MSACISGSGNEGTGRAKENEKRKICNMNWQTNTGGAGMSKDEAIERARENYMNAFWDQEMVVSNLYSECKELEEGDLEEWRIN